MDDVKLTENCGIFGLYSSHNTDNVSKSLFFALYSLQHRGQEGGGMSTYDGTLFHSHKGGGLISQVFDNRNIEMLKGYMGIGHTRYSTVGNGNFNNYQPIVIHTHSGTVAIAQNGTLTHYKRLRHKLQQQGIGQFGTSDGEVIAQLLANYNIEINKQNSASATVENRLISWDKTLIKFSQEVEAAYALVIMIEDAIYGIRDIHGFRPLLIGRKICIDSTTNTEYYKYMLSSESCAFETLGAEIMREVDPGEIVRIDKSGITVVQKGINPYNIEKAMCVFEIIYFSRPDSYTDSHQVHALRQRLGMQLAQESPVKNAEMVMGIPDSATPHAMGYALESGIPYLDGLCKNRYIARTFIHPDSDERNEIINMKYNCLHENIRGKSIVLVDDSIVRGNSIIPIIKLLRNGGAREIHVRISSPPIKHPCYMGINMSTYNELIAHNMDVDDICKHIGADSLEYLSYDGMLRALDTKIDKTMIGSKTQSGYCTACFTGKYAVDVNDIVDVNDW
jgi:amidophosphoribosyltransferase